MAVKPIFRNFWRVGLGSVIPDYTAIAASRDQHYNNYWKLWTVDKCFFVKDEDCNGDWYWCLSWYCEKGQLSCCVCCQHKQKFHSVSTDISQRIILWYTILILIYTMVHKEPRNNKMDFRNIYSKMGHLTRFLVWFTARILFVYSSNWS